MFIKLFKYDVIYLFKRLIYVYLLLFFSAILTLVFNLMFKNTKFISLVEIPYIVYNLTSNFLILITAFFGIKRYYKNLLTDEGYLTNTLPVAKSKILFSKLLAMVFYLIITYICLFLSRIIINPSAYKEIGSNLILFFNSIFNMSFDSSDIELSIIILLMLLILTLISLLQIFLATMCLSLGAISNNNKLFLGIVYFLASDFILFIFFVIYMALALSIIQSVAGIFIGLLIFALILALLLALCFFINVKVLNKHLNLS